MPRQNLWKLGLGMRNEAKLQQERLRARSRAGSSPLGAFALVFVEELFAQPDGLGGHLDQLVVVDEFERLFQIEADRRGQDNVLVGARGADVGQLLRLHGVDDQIVGARVDADDHPRIDVFPRTDQQPAAFLKIEQRVGERLPSPIEIKTPLVRWPNSPGFTGA